MWLTWGFADTAVIAGEGQDRGGGIMAHPRIILRGRRIILLSGYNDRAKGNAEEGSDARRGFVVNAEDKLSQAALRDPDAVAFGYVHGEWHAAA